MIHTDNHGPLILSSTYWGSDVELAGKYFISINAGAIRVMVPASRRAEIQEMRTARHCVLSRGPWPKQGRLEAVEILFDDRSDNPFVLWFTPESFDMLPAKPEPGKEWTLSVWDLKKGRPHKALERVCYWRMVEKIPCLKDWK